MNKANIDNCQQNMNSENAELSVSILDDLSKLCTSTHQNQPIHVTGSEIREGIFAELDSVEAPAVTVCFMITPETPVEVIAALSSTKPESAAIAAVRQYNNSPEAKALHDANKAHGHTAQQNDGIDTWRKGEGREYHNELKRAAYADTIMEMEEREVRGYTKHESDEDRDTARKERDKIAKRKRTENMTPAEKKEESHKRRVRRENAEKRKLQALIDQALF